MDQSLIFNPMGALVALTFVALLMIPFRRFQAGFRGQITRDDFRYGESANVPPIVAIPNRNLMNLLEMPLLFYVACLALFVSNRVNDQQLMLAWTYVGLRAAHSLVHLTFNKVIVRLTFFAASNVVLATIWLRFFFA